MQVLCDRAEMVASSVPYAGRLGSGLNSSPIGRTEQV